MHTLLIALQPLHNRCNHTWGPAFTIPQFKAFIVFFFFLFQSLKVKTIVETETFGNQLLLPVLHIVPGGQTSLVWRGAGVEEWNMCICCTEKSKIVSSFPTQQIPKCTQHTLTRTYTHTYIHACYVRTTVFYTMFIYRFYRRYICDYMCLGR